MRAILASYHHLAEVFPCSPTEHVTMAGPSNPPSIDPARILCEYLCSFLPNLCITSSFLLTNFLLQFLLPAPLWPLNSGSITRIGIKTSLPRVGKILPALGLLPMLLLSLSTNCWWGTGFDNRRLKRKVATPTACDEQSTHAPRSSHPLVLDFTDKGLSKIFGAMKPFKVKFWSTDGVWIMFTDKGLDPSITWGILANYHLDMDIVIPGPGAWMSRGTKLMPLLTGYPSFLFSLFHIR